VSDRTRTGDHLDHNQVIRVDDDDVGLTASPLRGVDYLTLANLERAGQVLSRKSRNGTSIPAVPMSPLCSNYE